MLAVAPGADSPTYGVHTDYGQGVCPVQAVYVDANNASGSVAPMRVLSGFAAELNFPVAVYERN